MGVNVESDGTSCRSMSRRERSADNSLLADIREQYKLEAEQNSRLTFFCYSYSNNTGDTDDGLAGKNVFKHEWEDSDAIFVVEQKKFHVHRQLLSLASPVFKVMMFSFREKDQREIPLSGKKAELFLSFLLIVYSLEDDKEITSEY